MRHLWLWRGQSAGVHYRLGREGAGGQPHASGENRKGAGTLNLKNDDTGAPQSHLHSEDLLGSLGCCTPIVELAAGAQGRQIAPRRWGGILAPVPGGREVYQARASVVVFLFLSFFFPPSNLSAPPGRSPPSAWKNIPGRRQKEPKGGGEAGARTGTGKKKNGRSFFSLASFVSSLILLPNSPPSPSCWPTPPASFPPSSSPRDGFPVRRPPLPAAAAGPALAPPPSCARARRRHSLSCLGRGSADVNKAQGQGQGQDGGRNFCRRLRRRQAPCPREASPVQTPLPRLGRPPELIPPEALRPPPQRRRARRPGHEKLSRPHGSRGNLGALVLAQPPPAHLYHHGTSSSSSFSFRLAGGAPANDSFPASSQTREPFSFSESSPSS